MDRMSKLHVVQRQSPSQTEQADSSVASGKQVFAEPVNTSVS